MSEYKVVNQAGVAIHPPEPIHPGEILADELEAREIKQKSFASEVGLRPSHLNELIKGKRNFSAQLALKIGRVLGIDASFWMRVQGEYFLDVARLEESEMQKL